MKERNNRITIHTLAKDLGLSAGTVSKIINNKGNVSDETRRKVLEYIEKVGYVPSSSARMLKSKRTYTIGVIFSEDLDIGLEQSFFSSILQHFKDYVEDSGYDLSFIVRRVGRNKLSYYEWCLNKRVDGVYIVVGNYNDKELIELINSELPCVSTDMIYPNLHTVVSDNESGMITIFDYIKNELNLTRVAYIAGPQSSKAFKERKTIFKELHESYNLVATDIVDSLSFGFTSGYNATEEVIKNNNNPEIIVVGSDELALGVLKALSDNNINVPKDIQVIGFDDIAFAKYYTPSLTTIRQDRKMLGQLAAKNLISQIEGKIKTNESIEKIPVKLITRETTNKY